jgi:hypothetical protein
MEQYAQIPSVAPVVVEVRRQAAAAVNAQRQAGIAAGSPVATAEDVQRQARSIAELQSQIIQAAEAAARYAAEAWQQFIQLEAETARQVTFRNGEISDYQGPGGSVVIPAVINGQAVTKIRTMHLRTRD